MTQSNFKYFSELNRNVLILWLLGWPLIFMPYNPPMLFNASFTIRKSNLDNGSKEVTSQSNNIVSDIQHL